MEKSLVQLRNVTGFLPADPCTVIVECPVGPRYHTILLGLAYTGGTNTAYAACASINQLRVKVGGRIQREMTGQQLYDMNTLNGVDYGGYGTPNSVAGTGNNGAIIPIHFAEPWRKNPVDQDSLAWATAGWPSMQLEIELADRAAGEFVAHAVIDGFQPKNEAMIMKVIRTASAAGTVYDFNGIDRRDWLSQISIYPASGTNAAVVSATFKKDNVIVHEGTRGMAAGRSLAWGMAPAATSRSACLDLVFDSDDMLGSALNMNSASDAVLTITNYASDAVSGTNTLIFQRIGPVE